MSKQKSLTTLDWNTFSSRNTLFYGLAQLPYFNFPNLKTLLISVDTYLHFYKYLLFLFPKFPNYFQIFPKFRLQQYYVFGKTPFTGT